MYIEQFLELSSEVLNIALSLIFLCPDGQYFFFFLVLFNLVQVDFLSVAVNRLVIYRGRTMIRMQIQQEDDKHRPIDALEFIFKIALLQIK